MNFSHSSQPEIARSNITTIIYNSCTENRSTQVCHQFPADLVTFTEKIVNGKLHFLCVANFFHIMTFSRKAHFPYCILASSFSDLLVILTVLVELIYADIVNILN